jgi:glycosyltransferase involved in cell wall biosynthesis
MIFVRQCGIPFSVFYHSLSPDRYLTDANSENFRFVLQKAKYNFFTSEMQINLLQQQLDCRIENAFILNHPLRNIKSERSIGTKKNGFNFCIIGSLVARWKGQDIAINILSKERWRYLNWHLNLYGEGPDREALIKLISEKNISHKVTLYGQINDVNKLYADNDLVLIPSKQDSGPIVMFEAMLAAKPIVGSYMGAMPEYIQTGMNGVLAEAADEDSFEKAMESAWNQKDEWATWGRNAKIYLQQRYDFSPAQTLINFLINKL